MATTTEGSFPLGHLCGIRRACVTSLTVGTCFLVLGAQPAAAEGSNTSGIIEAISDVARNLGPFWGATLFIALYAVSTVLLIPASFLTLAAGALFGAFKGTLIVSIASTIGAVAAFLIARYLAKPWVESKLEGNQKLQKIIGAISAEGTKLVLLLRLSPIFPFSLLNYALGLTTISLQDYTLASWLGMLPATFAYVYVGGVGRAAADSAASGQSISPQQLALWGIGAASTLLVTKIVSNAASKAIAEAEAQQASGQQREDQEQHERNP